MVWVVIGIGQKDGVWVGEGCKAIGEDIVSTCIGKGNDWGIGGGTPSMLVIVGSMMSVCISEIEGEFLIFVLIVMSFFGMACAF